jgi:hypothetical protein
MPLLLFGPLRNAADSGNESAMIVTASILGSDFVILSQARFLVQRPLP